MNRREIFQSVNSKILSKLKEGVIPWRKTWKQGVPSNFVTRKPYQGINYLSLATENYPSPYYLTFNQVKKFGGQIAKGSKGSLIVFWKILELDNDVDDVKTIPLLRYSYVFNLSQTTLFAEENLEPNRISCDKIIANIKNEILIKHNIQKCFYSVNGDYISIPILADFESEEEYYSSLFHEIIHATGHPKRLDRFDKIDKVTEELVAEIGASYLCGLAGIEDVTIDNQSAYIDAWMKLAEKDSLLFVKVAKMAQEAVNYICGFNSSRGHCTALPEE